MPSLSWILAFLLHGVDGVGGLDFEGDGLAGQSLHEYLRVVFCVCMNNCDVSVLLRHLSVLPVCFQPLSPMSTITPRPPPPSSVITDKPPPTSQ
jgi:hypothetical protein